MQITIDTYYQLEAKKFGVTICCEKCFVVKLQKIGFQCYLGGKGEEVLADGKQIRW